MYSNVSFFLGKKGVKSDKSDKERKKVHSNVTFILGKKRKKGILCKDSFEGSEEKCKISGPLIIKD